MAYKLKKPYQTLDHWKGQAFQDIFGIDPTESLDFKVKRDNDDIVVSITDEIQLIAKIEQEVALSYKTFIEYTIEGFDIAKNMTINNNAASPLKIMAIYIIDNYISLKADKPTRATKAPLTEEERQLVKEEDEIIKLLKAKKAATVEEARELLKENGAA